MTYVAGRNLLTAMDRSHLRRGARIPLRDRMCCNRLFRTGTTSDDSPTRRCARLARQLFPVCLPKLQPALRRIVGGRSASIYRFPNLRRPPAFRKDRSPHLSGRVPDDSCNGALLIPIRRPAQSLRAPNTWSSQIWSESQCHNLYKEAPPC